MIMLKRLIAISAAFVLICFSALAIIILVPQRSGSIIVTYHNGFFDSREQTVDQKVPLYRDRKTGAKLTKANKTKLLSIGKTKFENIGHSFTGWMLENGEPTETNYIAGGLSKDDSETITYYAIWDVNTYLISFYSQAPGVPAPAEQEIEYGGTVHTEWLADREAAGLKFNGWYTDRNGKGLQVSNNDTVYFVKNTALYASWIPNGLEVINFKINYNTKASDATLHGDGLVGTYQYVNDDNIGTDSLATVTRTDTRYKFQGWFYANTDGSEVKVTTLAQAHGLLPNGRKDITLYAKWGTDGETPNPDAEYTVSVICKSGDTVLGTHSYPKYPEGKELKYTKQAWNIYSGYTLATWSVSKSGNTWYEVQTNGDLWLDVYSDVTITINYTKNQTQTQEYALKIKCVVNGTVFDDYEPIIYVKDKQLVFYLSAWEGHYGYKFASWEVSGGWSEVQDNGDLWVDMTSDVLLIVKYTVK